MADSLEEFEKRLELLENSVFGTSSKDAYYPKVEPCLTLACSMDVSCSVVVIICMNK